MLRVAVPVVMLLPSFPLLLWGFLTLADLCANDTSC